MKKYKIRINCACHDDVEVEANNKEEAIEKAENDYHCDGNSGEFCEFLERGE